MARTMWMRRALAIAAAMWLTVATTPNGARAQAADVEAGGEVAFDKAWALGVYGTGWHGPYGAGGIGGKLRWEPLDWLGIELFSEHTFVDHPDAANRSRHDHPIGFNLYVPLSIVDGFRVRALAGMCANFSFIEGDEFTPGAEDVQFGVHAGGGLEVALGGTVSLFFDAMWIGWLGHDRAVHDWTGAVSDGVQWEHYAQFNGGLSIHL